MAGTSPAMTPKNDDYPRQFVIGTLRG